MRYFKYIIVLTFSLYFSCVESDNTTGDTADIVITANDFNTTINENPSVYQALGVISASASEGELSFEIVEQNPENAIDVNATTGEITIVNASLFDYETNPVIIAVVLIYNEDISQTITVTINLLDEEENGVTAFDLYITVFEMPLPNEYLGTVEAYATEGAVTFSIMEQTPSNLLHINTVTGEVSSNYEFNFFENEIIEAIIRVQKEGAVNVYKDVAVTVHLTHECDIDNASLLLAHYPFNGNALDESGYNNHGLINTPNLTTDRFFEENKAYYFNGIDDVITIPDSEQLSLGEEFTISAWVYPEEIKSQQIIRKGSAVNGVSSWPYGLSLSGTNDIVFSITAGGDLYQARKVGYNINEWFLITGVLKDQKMYLYVNGELNAVSPINGTIYDDQSPLLIGTRLNLPSSTFKGVIDDVRIYDTAICEEEIRTLFNN